MCGGRPAASSAGSATSPPPPAIASTSPATKAAPASSEIVTGDCGGITRRLARMSHPGEIRRQDLAPDGGGS